MGADLDGLAGLEQSINQLQERWGSTKRVVYLVGSNVNYAPMVEYGTGPHTIEGDPLAFSVGGETVFAKSVDHPGTDAQPFMRPAADAAERQLGRLAKQSNSIEEFVQKTAFVVEAEAKRRVPVDSGNLKASIETQRVQ